MRNSYWPLFDLRIRSERVEIRLATDEDLVQLARLAAGGVHDPATMPFLKPWTDELSPDLERGLLQWGWRHRATWRADAWTFTGVVVVDNAIVGVQDITAQDFARDRVVKTGSWLGVEHHGRGIGTAMRQAALSFAFEGLGAQMALSGGFVDNRASLGVSRRLGYEESGRRSVLRRGTEAEVIELHLSRAVWSSRPHPTTEFVALEECREFFVGTVEPTDRER
jgi:RimJ/RimL family protein N-acetyltransferase